MRKLCRSAYETCEQNPLLALYLADTARAIADQLSDGSYPANTIWEIRGLAWKERANALRIRGKFNEALDSLDHAERAYRRIGSQRAMGIARVTHIRAVIRWEQERYDEALALTRDAMKIFAHLGQTDRYVATRFLEASVHLECRNVAAARSIFELVRAHGESSDDALWLARAAQALGNCALEIGDTVVANREFHIAKRIFTELGKTAEVLRTDWGMARVFLVVGKEAEGMRRLSTARDSMADLGMTIDAAVATLDLVEVLHGARDSRSVRSQAHSLVEIFVAAGMLTGALTAAAYLRDSASEDRVTPALIDHLRIFFRRFSRQPDLLFAAP